MAADETDGEADWLGKSLQAVTASLTVQDYRFSNSATALGVSENRHHVGGCLQEGCEGRLQLRQIHVSQVRKYRSCQCECNIRGRAQMVGKDLTLLRRLDCLCLTISSPSLSSDSG
jgi:hypothetical protein